MFSLIFHAYMIFNLAYRTQLITALNAKPQRSNSNIRRTTSQATSKLPLARKTFKKADYPNVKHWERRQNDAVQFAVIKVYDSDFSDSDSDSNEGTTKRERGVLAFLEDKNGKVIDRHERKRLYSELRGFWNDNIDSNCPPDNWSSAGATLRDKFRDVLEEKFPFLCLCTGRWKVEALWKKNYHSWKRSLLARQARKTPLVAGSSDKGKRKRKESLEPANLNSLDETEALLDAPQPKKAKTGMASIPIAGPSQLVCRLIDNARLSVTAATNYFFSTQFDRQ